MARSLMDEGDAKVEARDFAGALRAYRAAHAIMNVPSTGIEVARMEAQLGRLVMARKVALEVAALPAKAGEPKPFTEAREAARKLAEELEQRIPLITVVVQGAPSGAPVEVKIDGEAVPSEEARAPQPVDPGKHEVAASASGSPPASKEVEVAEGQRISVTLSLGGAALGRGKAGGVSPLVIAGFGLGGAGILAGAITGILSLSRASAVGELCPSGLCPTQEKLDQARPLNDSALTLANVSNIAFALGAVGVGLGVAGIFLGGGESKQDKPSASLRVTVGPAGVGLAGRF